MPLTEMYRKNLVVDDIEEEGGDQHGEAVGSSVQMLKSSAAVSWMHSSVSCVAY